MMTLNRQDVTFDSLGQKVAAMLFLPDGDRPAPALIVCHGAGEYKENYYEMCEQLCRKGVAALAVDMHGHGKSGGERYYVDMREWVADVIAAVDFLSRDSRIEAGRIGAFGLSSGGTAILEAALVEPRLKALVALDATVRTSMPFVAVVVLKFLIALGSIKRLLTHQDLRLSLLKMLEGVRMASDPDVEKRLRANPAATAAFRSFPFPGAAHSFFVDTLRRVSLITIPTMVIWGEDDQLDSPETARLLYDALLCKKRLHIIPGNGHVGHLDRNRDQVFALTADWALENLA